MPKVLTDLQSVVTAAAAVVDEAGPDALTFSAVAERLGVSPSAVYHYVGDAAGLRSAVAIATLQELGDVVVGATIGLSGPEAIASVLDAWRAWAREHPSRYEISSGSCTADDDEAIAASRSLVNVLTTILERAGHPPAGAAHAARYLRSCIHGFVMLEISGGFVLDADVDETYDDVKRRVVGGLVASPQG